ARRAAPGAAGGAGPTRLDLARPGQGGEDDLARLRDRLGRVRPHRAQRQVRLGQLVTDVVHHQGVPGFQDIESHRSAHVAEPDEADPHAPLLPAFPVSSRRWVRALVLRYTNGGSGVGIDGNERVYYAPLSIARRPRVRRFELVLPGSLDDCVKALARHGSEAKLLAGGTDLLPQMKNALLKPAVVIDLSG